MKSGKPEEKALEPQIKAENNESRFTGNDGDYGRFLNHIFTLMDTDYTEKPRQKQKRLNHGRHGKKRENTENGKGKSEDSGF